ncbi:MULTISPECIES: SGNH/GDSL hydrolase family protein [Aphanothece]|uniref:SGNH/GDSL hydrolase family protein n=1 Tax=Aphanothece TaxID=1121 RepID=UPI00398495C8
MTTSLVMLGDSLVDTGNLDELARLVGQDPFEERIYDRGGNVKASDGPVFAEQIARRLGARLNSIERVNLLDLPARLIFGSGGPAPQLLNYAYAGATSGLAGSRRAGLAPFPLGLLSQARLASSTLPARDDLDALIIAGSNDLTDLAHRPRALLKVLRSPGQRDNRRLRDRTARRIAANVRRSVDTITGQVDETLIVGLAPLSATPYLQRVASRFSPSLEEAFLRFIDSTARRVNRRLERRFNAPGRDDDVLVVDGFKAWQSVAAPRFLDDVHPTSRTSGRLADFVVRGIAGSSDLSSYGFAT